MSRKINTILPKARALLAFCLLSCLTKSDSFPQETERLWRIAFTSNLKYAFPEAGDWLQEFDSSDVTIEVIDDYQSLDELITVHTLLALEGEYNPEHWDPVINHHEKIQIHFWPITRGKDINQLKDLANEDARILHDERDLISRTGQTIFSSLESIYEVNILSNLVASNELSSVSQAFTRRDELNIIFLPLINYNPNQILFQVIQDCPPRSSLEISARTRLALFDSLNSQENIFSGWEQSRLSNLFFPGYLKKGFLNLKQRALRPVQTTANIYYVINKQNSQLVQERDLELLVQDLNEIYASLIFRNKEALMAEEKKIVDPDYHPSEADISTVLNILERARFLFILAPDKTKTDSYRRRLKRFIRGFASKINDFRVQVRFREIDYLLDTKDFWAINNLAHVYNNVGNYTATFILADEIIDIESSDHSIELKIPIPFDPNSSIQNRDRQYDEHFARFLDHYAYALEKLNFRKFSPFIRNEASHRREKWRLTGGQ